MSYPPRIHRRLTARAIRFAAGIFGLALSLQPAARAQSGSVSLSGGSYLYSGGSLSSGSLLLIGTTSGSTFPSFTPTSGTLSGSTVNLSSITLSRSILLGSTLNTINLTGGSTISLTGNTLSYPAGSYTLISPLQTNFFSAERSLGNSVYYTAMPNGNPFGYYCHLGYYLSSSLPSKIGEYIYHFDMGYEAVSDAGDAQHGIYLYDFASQTWFYTSPTFPFPYLYDFSLQSVVYYYPDPKNPGRYNTEGVRYFYNFATGQIITK